MAKSVTKATTQAPIATTTNTDSNHLGLAQITSLEPVQRYKTNSKQKFNANFKMKDGTIKPFSGELSSAKGMEDSFLISDTSKFEGREVAVKKINESFKMRDGSTGTRTVAYTLKSKASDTIVVSDSSFFGA